jgi:hypothetical protein
MEERWDARSEEMEKRWNARSEEMDKRWDARFGRMEQRFDALQRTLIQGGTVIVAALIGLIATQL